MEPVAGGQCTQRPAAATAVTSTGPGGHESDTQALQFGRYRSFSMVKLFAC